MTTTTDDIVQELKEVMRALHDHGVPPRFHHKVHAAIHEIVRLRAVLDAIDALLQEVKSGDRVHLPIVLNEIENLIIHPTASSSQPNLHDRPEGADDE